ncbi:unnamed protein product [Ectocarpus sp. 6 AP-2014]
MNQQADASPSAGTTPSLGSQYSYSEQNPLTSDDPSVYYTDAGEPKKPQAVALHGWQRTVGVDDDFDATIPVRLGAPGTGLATAKVPANGGAMLGPSMGRGNSFRPQQQQQQQQEENSAAVGQPTSAPGLGLGAVVDLGNVKVTKEDKREAKSLRVQPAAEGAAPLPYPRVADVASSSSSSSSAGTDVDDPTGRQKERQESQFETSSAASSDMSFLVNTASGAFFGGRQTFGRAIEPRIPATVGEERLHNSLAQYMGGRRNLASRGGAMSTGGESHTSISVTAATADGAATAVGGADRLVGEVTAPATTNGGTAAAAAAAAVGNSSANTTALSLSGDSGSTMNTGDSQESAKGVAAAAAAAAPEELDRKSKIRRGSKGGSSGGGGGGEEETKGGSATRRGGPAERIAKQSSFGGEDDEPVEPGERAIQCSCLRRTWPWGKIFSGVVTLGGVVVLVVLVAAAGDSSGTGRRLFAPQLLSSSGGGASSSRWPARGRPAVGAGGHDMKVLRYSHSRRRLSASRAGLAGGGSAARLRGVRPMSFDSSTQAASGCGDATASGDVAGAGVGGSGAEPPGGGGDGAGGMDSRGRAPPRGRDGRLRGRRKTSEPERRKEEDARATNSGSTEEGATT